MPDIDTPAHAYYPLPQQPIQNDRLPAVHNDTSPSIDIETPVLIIGAGPTGLLLTYILSHIHNIPCILVERLTAVSRFPKMEFHSPRTMEILHRVGIADHLRTLGVPEEYDFDELIVTGSGNSEAKLIKRLPRPSPAEMRKRSYTENTGQHTREPWMRCQQDKLEVELRKLVGAEKNAETLYGWEFVSLKEGPDFVTVTIRKTDSSETKIVQTRYLVGTDGGGSAVRHAAGLNSARRSLDLHFMLVHFKSKSFDILNQHGRFWHSTTLTGGLIVNQDEQGGTWTIHAMCEPGADPNAVDGKEFVKNVLGGMHGPIEDLVIDEVLVKGYWTAQVAIADSMQSRGVYKQQNGIARDDSQGQEVGQSEGRIFLAGDAAHQLSPVGGHGYNSGVGDAWDLSWKLTGVINGWASPELLKSYDVERRPVAYNNLAHVEKGISDYVGPVMAVLPKYGPELILADSDEGHQVRQEISNAADHAYWLHNQHGNYVDFRYRQSPINCNESSEDEPKKELEAIVPSTYPGSRAPHVWLKDKVTSIFDQYGHAFTLVDFNPDNKLGKIFDQQAKALSIPMKRLSVVDEATLRQIWERDLVLIRPDGHVCWRVPTAIHTMNENEVRAVLEKVTGRA